MLKQLFRDSIVYSLGRALSAVVGIVLLPIYTAQLAPAQFGLYDMGYLVMTLGGLVVGLEIAQGAARYYCDDSDLEARRSYFSTALMFTVAAFAVFSGAAIALAPVIARPILGPDADTASLALVVTAASAIACFRLALNQLRWMLRPWAYFCCTLIQIATTSVLSVVLVLRGHGAHGLFVGLIAGNAIGFAGALLFGHRGLGFAWSSAHLRAMLSFSTPLVASSAAVFVATYIDRIAIKELMTMGDLGHYGVAYRFAAAVGLVMTGFDTALMPLIYTHHRDPGTPSQLAKLLRRILLLGSAVVVGLAAFATDIVHVFAASEYQAAASVVAVLAAGVFLTKLQSVAPGLWIAKKTGAIAVINLLIALVNLGLNLLLIPRIGIYGAALATLVGAAFGFGINLAASQAAYPVKHDWGRIVGGALIVAVAVASLDAIGRVLTPMSVDGLAFKFIGSLFAVALAAAVLLTRDELRAIALWLRRSHR